MNIATIANDSSSSKLLAAMQSAADTSIHLDTVEEEVPPFEREEAMRFHPLFNLLGWMGIVSYRTYDLDTKEVRLPG